MTWDREHRRAYRAGAEKAEADRDQRAAELQLEQLTRIANALEWIGETLANFIVHYRNRP